MNKDNHTVRIAKLSANITPDLLDQIDRLVELNRPFAKRHAIHVAALRVGLAEITANPNRLLEALAG